MTCSLTGCAPLALPGPSLRVEVAERMAELPDGWSELVPATHPLLARPLLDAAVAAAPEGSLPRFVLAFDGDQPVAAALFVAVPLRRATLGQLTSASKWPLRATLQVLSVAHCGDPHVMVCGDVVRSDTAGLHIRADQPQPIALFHQMSEAARRSLPVSVAIVVCSAHDAGPDSDTLPAHGYHRVDKAQPSMRVDLLPEWRSWEDYLGALRKKYRQRARSARKRGAALEREVLELAGIRAHQEELDALLAPILDRAPVTLVRPDTATLLRLKETLGDRLVVRLYRHEGQVVAFSSSLHRSEAVEGVLVGFDDRRNRDLKLYQNILYDFIEEALQQGARSVDLGRTALEIKSAVGARPTEHPLYIRHPSALLHPVLGWAAGAIPSPEWTPRHAFREGPPAAAR